jgi:hypothetical protein
MLINYSSKWLTKHSGLFCLFVSPPDLHLPAGSEVPHCTLQVEKWGFQSYTLEASNHLRPAPSIQPLDFCGKQRHVSLLKWEKASRSIFQLGGIHFKLLASRDTEKYNNIAWTQILGPSQTRFNVSGGVTHPWKWTTHQESLANSGKDCRRIGFGLFNLPPPVYIFISCPASLICHGPQNSLQ